MQEKHFIGILKELLTLSKRKVIGRTFIDIFDNESVNLHASSEIDFLAQGTIYPDVIESSESESKEARIIKSHHNVGELPEEMKMSLVEPLEIYSKTR